jgi:hypothetical protein
MKRWIVLIAAVGLVALVPLLVAASRALYAPAPPRAPSLFTPPVEVGKTYGFGVSGADLIGKVLEEPRGDWLKVEFREGDKVERVWLNLQQVSYVQPDPPTEKGCTHCPGEPKSM